MDDQDLISICKVNNPTEAEIIRGLLQSAGIACQIGGESQAGLAGVLEIDVLTHASDAKEARTILRQVRRDKVERKKKRIAARKAKEQNAASEAIQELKPPSTNVEKPEE